MNTLQTDKRNRIYTYLFVLIFFIANFNALLQIFVPRMVLTSIYLLFLGVAIFRNLRINNFKISVANGTVAILLYILWVVIRFVFQIVGGERTSQSFISFAQTLVPIFAFYIATDMNTEDARKCEKAFVFFALVSVLLGFLNRAVKIIPESYFANELVRVEGLIYNRFYSMSGYSLGTGWMCGVAIAFLLGSGNTMIKKPIIKIAAYIAFIAAVLLTFSRGGIFFTLIILVVYLFSNLFANREHMGYGKFLGLMLTIATAVVLVVVFWDKIISSSFYSRYVVNAFDSGSLRTGFHRQALQYIAQHPMLGKGYGFVGTTAYASGIGAGFPPENNYYLIAINTGLIGLSLFIMSSVLPVVKKIIGWGGYKTDSRVIVYIGIVTGALAWSLMSTPLEGDINTMVFWYSMGRILSTTDSRAMGSEYSETGESFAD